MKALLRSSTLFLLLLMTSCQNEIIEPELSSALNEAESLYKRALESDDAAEFFFRAAVIWEHAVEQWGLKNGYIYYNIANSWMNGGDTGKAVLYYRKAQLYLPGNEKIQQNLNLARQSIVFSIPDEEINPLFKTLFFVHYEFSRKTRLNVLISLLLFLSIGGSIYIFRKNRILLNSMYILTAISFIFIFSLLTSALSPDEGVVLKGVTARQGDSNGYERSFTEDFPPGIEFSILEKRSDWLFIELNDGRTCWIPEESTGLIKD